MRRVKQALALLAIVFAAAQFVRPDRANPPIDAARTIHAYIGAANGLAAILDRSCGDCHSNATVWPWYTQIAPLSWLMARGVAEGRQAVNFSEWGAYSPEQQRALLALSCEDVTDGRMPGPFTLLRPDTRLSAQDIATLCAASRQVDTPRVVVEAQP